MILYVVARPPVEPALLVVPAFIGLLVATALERRCSRLSAARR